MHYIEKCTHELTGGRALRQQAAIAPAVEPTNASLLVVNGLEGDKLAAVRNATRSEPLEDTIGVPAAGSRPVRNWPPPIGCASTTIS